MSDTQDRWSKWFTRAMQTVGLLMIITQAVAVYFGDHKPQPWLLLVAVAMMLGGYGLRMILRGASGILSDDTEKK